jgi:hypothetical protein
MKAYPLPEAIDGHEWMIEEGLGSVDTVHRVMAVPLGVSESARHVKAHELAHAKITPRHAAHKLAKKYGISMAALQCVEDLRVHRFLRHCQLETGGVLMTQETSDRLLNDESHTTRDIALHFVGSLYTPDYDLIKASAAKVRSDEDVAEIERRVLLIERRMNQAKLLFRPIGFRNATAPCARLFDALFPEAGRSDGDAVPLEILLKGSDTRRRSGCAKWGKLTVVVPHLSELHPVPSLSRRNSYTDEGTTLKAPYRLPIDGRVFSRRRVDRGGTVLIDASGSMALSLEDIRRLVLAAPSAVVAIYCGTGKFGTLTVVARKGRVVDHAGLVKARTYGNGNIVDGPALEWLGKQPGPRVWVSDGFVTGVNDTTSVDLGAAAQVTCNRGSIRRVERSSGQSLDALFSKR